jgi:hypothetical protein
MKLIPQREHFAGAELLSPAWTLWKGQRSAACTVWSHEFGFELRLVVSGDPLTRTEVCRRQEDLIAAQDAWRAALESKSWTKV